MPLPDTVYCSQQINIPPELPDILKNYTKAAIRAQPEDLYMWSAAYFRELKEKPIATQKTDTGLTPDLLKTMHEELSHKGTCSEEELQKKWEDLCLPLEQLGTLLSLGGFDGEIQWMEFFALGCTALGRTLLSSLKFACEILTEDEEGGAARIPFTTFTKLYTYLAQLNGDVPQDQIDSFLSSLKPEVELQHGMIKPLDFVFRDFMDSTPHDSSNSARLTSRAN